MRLCYIPPLDDALSLQSWARGDRRLQEQSRCERQCGVRDEGGLVPSDAGCGKPCGHPVTALPEEWQIFFFNLCELLKKKKQNSY